MKLAVAYSVFSGCELLPYSIKQIRENVDWIVVSYSEQDWWGKSKISPYDLDILKDLKKQKLIDELLCFPIKLFANNSREAKNTEIEKRNYLRTHCYNRGYDHFLMLDVDELFETDQFIKAKNFIEETKYQYSYCRLIEYHKLPIYQNTQVSRIHIPFICKLDPKKKLGTNSLKNVFIDPTRGYNIDRHNPHWIFKPEDLLMHHMTTVRRDLQLKYRSTSQTVLDRSHDSIINITGNINAICDKNLKLFHVPVPGINHVVNVKIVDNLFNIDYNGW